MRGVRAAMDEDEIEDNEDRDAEDVDLEDHESSEAVELQPFLAQVIETYAEVAQGPAYYRFLKEERFRAAFTAGCQAFFRRTLRAMEALPASPGRRIVSDDE